MRESVKMGSETQRTVDFVFPGPKRPARQTQGSSPESPGRLPRVTRLLALAIRFQGLVQQGMVQDYSDLAHLGRVSRARITQIMNLLNLAADIQEWLLFLNTTRGGRVVMSERRLRTVSQAPCWQDQRDLLAECMKPSRHVRARDGSAR